MTLRVGAADIAFAASITQRPRVSMPELPLLSIIIVAYKSRDEIPACLAALPREIDRQRVEVIVIDNSPGDGTGAIVREKFPWVDYRAAETNLGFGRANNAGYARARGEFILFLNPD